MAPSWGGARRSGRYRFPLPHALVLNRHCPRGFPNSAMSLKGCLPMKPTAVPVYFAAGLRTPFLKTGGAFAHLDAIALSLPAVKAMMARLNGSKPDFAVWGTVIPNLTWSNIA